jgi:FkbM family methyltransferase
VRYLRRDEDPPGIGPARLLARAVRELASDVRRAVRDWDPVTGAGLAATMARYHWSLALGRNGGERRTFRIRWHGTEIRGACRTDLSDLFVLREVFVHRIYEFPYERHVGPVRRVLDLGSNAGFSPLYFSLVCPGAEIACVEPVGANVELVRENAARNRLPWTVHQAAVAATPGEVTLYSSGWWASSSTTKEVAQARAASQHRPERQLGGTEETVRAVTVPDLLDELGWDTVDVVKMDIEGAERDVLLDGDTSWLDRVGVLVLDIHAKYVPRERIVARLAGHGFTPAAEAGAHSAVFLSPRARDRRVAARRSTNV